MILPHIVFAAAENSGVKKTVRHNPDFPGEV